MKKDKKWYAEAAKTPATVRRAIWENALKYWQEDDFLIALVHCRREMKRLAKLDNVTTNTVKGMRWRFLSALQAFHEKYKDEYPTARG